MRLICKVNIKILPPKKYILVPRKETIMFRERRGPSALEILFSGRILGTDKVGPYQKRWRRKIGKAALADKEEREERNG